MKKTPFKTIKHKVDFCVVGGGMAGLCAAIAAARHGVKTLLMHDRPVLGGNASSECRMHICGADRHNTIKNMRETGILEEIRLENLYQNPTKNYHVWDYVLFSKAKDEKNLTLLLNCSCLDAKCSGNSIKSVKGWQLSTELWHEVEAAIFADCSGDSILAPLCGAEFRMGREARSEFNESIEPVNADAKTMGMTCMFTARKYEKPMPFNPPDWAYTFDSCDDLPYGFNGHKWFSSGYWWIELGEDNSIEGTEETRDELLRIVFGVWDHIKNRCPHTKTNAENWALDWVQFLPAKRESRRYVGPKILTQNDIEAEGKFEDIVAYGGWSMDDHNILGFHAVKKKEPATIFHHAPSPYGIPYRCLYSKNIKNLMFAGRNISCTHAAMSSTRVMATCSVVGQAVGTAAALAIKNDIMPASVLEHIKKLQQILIKDDCYLPWIKQEFNEKMLSAKFAAANGDPSNVLLDGYTRPIEKESHRWEIKEGDWLSLSFPKKEKVNELRLIFDSALDKDIALSCLHGNEQLCAPPDVLPKSFKIQLLSGDTWMDFCEIRENRRRFVNIKVDKHIDGIKFILRKTWGSGKSGIHSVFCE